MATLNKLTVKDVQSAKPTEKITTLADGGGLCLQITPTGSKRWRFRYTHHGSGRWISMGVYPDTSLKLARQKRDEARRLLAEGKDPGAVRKAEKESYATTFKIVADEWLEDYAAKVTEQTLSETKSRFTRFVYPTIGNMPIQEITVQHIRTILDRIHARSGPSDTLKKTRQGLSQIFRYAAIDGRVTQDPVEPLKRYDKYLCTKPKQHRPSIIDRGETEIIDLYAIGGLLRAVECYTGHLYIRFGLRLLAYLAVRPGELISARWEDFDLDNRIWLLPAYQKKERRDLVVPLPPQAVEILRHLHASTGHTEYVLSSIQGHSEVLSENTLARALWRMGYKGKHTPHGYRSLFRTCLVEVLGYNKDWVEAQLGHVSRDPNGRAYDRVTWIAERTNMMAVWATFLDMVKEGHRIDDEVIQNLKTQQQAKHSKVVPLYRNSAA